LAVPKPIENVLYVLGAGFSAPLGLPVTSNFLAMARDQFAAEPERYKHFTSIFAKIDDLSRIKNVFQCDLRNVEEILSLLEMRSFLDEGEGVKEFIQFLEDVISFHTPTLAWTAPQPGAGGPPYAFGGDRLTNEYTRFIAAIFKLIVNPTVRPKIARETPGQRRYAIITTNYDRVLENFARYLIESAGELTGGDCVFVTDASGFLDTAPALTKLHGGVGEGNIVPPTWSKGSHASMRPNWRLAEKLIAQANRIRVIGYALAPADAYVRYLFKLAMLTSTNLKSIDVLCLDPDGSVKTNYDSFVDAHSFRGYRFVSQDFAQYTRFLNNEAHSIGSQTESAAVEATHTQFFGRPF
jgi:hypothetical protein